MEKLRLELYSQILEQARKRKVTMEMVKQKCREFREKEGRARFFDLACEIVDKYPLHASVIILATWNKERFQYAMMDSKNLDDLEKAIKKCQPLFDKIKDKDFPSAKFDEIGDVVREIYDILSKVKGVEYTGASKIMHLFNRSLFVMWDRNIRKEYGFYFKNIEMTTGADYLFFQKVMQEIFGDIKWEESDKTLAKAIDEFNYMSYSYPKLREKSRQSKEK
jgi:hypothetical protein